MADTTPQQHAEALEQALSESADIIKHAWHWHADPVKGDPLGRSRYEVITIGRTITRTYYTDPSALQEAVLICAAVNAARSLLDERKRLVAAIEKYEADDVRYMAERKRLREALSEYVKAFEAHHITNTHGARDFDFTGRIAALAQEALK